MLTSHDFLFLLLLLPDDGGDEVRAFPLSHGTQITLFRVVLWKGTGSPRTGRKKSTQIVNRNYGYYIIIVVRATNDRTRSLKLETTELTRTRATLSMAFMVSYNYWAGAHSTSVICAICRCIIARSQ